MTALSNLRIVPIVVAVLILATARSESVAREQPNILFLLADDQRGDAIGAWGNPHIRTPHIDRLVQQGMSFKRTYCMGSLNGAVCVPSRAMMLGGRTLFRTDMNLTGQTTLPELLGNSGFVTFATGKWHNGQASLLRSFHQARSVMLGGMSNHSRVPLYDLQKDGSLGGPCMGSRFSSTEFADAAVEFLANCDRDQPFFCYVAFTAPHDPRMPPAPFDEMYLNSLPPLPANFLPQHPFDTGQLAIRDEVLAGWPRTRTVISEQLAAYYGMISQMDEQIGRILQTLGERELMDNTVIIFAADHGLALGSHGLLGKQNLYEHSMRAPLVIGGPGVPANSLCNELVYLHDLYPTICDYGQVSPPAGIEGISLRPVIEGKVSGIRESLFTAYSKFGRAVRQGDWKLIRWPQVNKTQLFNLAMDPHEMLDLSGDSKNKSHIDRLVGVMAEWQCAVDDTQPLWVAGAKAEPVDLTIVKRKPDPWQPKWIVEKYFDIESGDDR